SDFCPTPYFILNLFSYGAVADCIENALQTKLFSTLVILAGVGRRNHFFKIRFLSHSLELTNCLYQNALL
ncbi:hypothetical protein, partial [Staphylococcus arlettae]|uniref:hypothetical protein n=1 Tax=Staphylococcus arlettae TaxID=29378 RepID=UPI001788C344